MNFVSSFMNFILHTTVRKKKWYSLSFSLNRRNPNPVYSLFLIVCREKHGDCIGNMIKMENIVEVSDGQYLHWFQRRDDCVPITTLMVGDRVVLSDEDSSLFGLSTGYIQEVNRTKLSCLLDRY